MINEYCKLDSESEMIMKLAFDKYKISARGFTRILKVARTIADLEGKEFTSVYFYCCSEGTECVFIASMQKLAQNRKHQATSSKLFMLIYSLTQLTFLKHF